MEENKREFVRDLIKTQKEIKTIGMDSNNPFHRSKYASLKVIMENVKPACNNNNIFITQLVSSNDAGGVIVKTKLIHITGEELSTSITIKPLPDKNGKVTPQSIGSTISYLKRYSVGALLGAVSGEEDDDGESSMGREQKPPVKVYKETVKPKIKPADNEMYQCINAECSKIGMTGKYREFDISINKNGIWYAKCKTCGKVGKVKDFLMGEVFNPPKEEAKNEKNNQ